MVGPRQIAPSPSCQVRVHASGDRATVRATSDPVALDGEHQASGRRFRSGAAAHHAPARYVLEPALRHLPSSTPQDLCKNPGALAHPASSLCVQPPERRPSRCCDVDGSARSNPRFVGAKLGDPVAWADSLRSNRLSVRSVSNPRRSLHRWQRPRRITSGSPGPPENRSGTDTFLGTLLASGTLGNKGFQDVGVEICYHHFRGRAVFRLSRRDHV